MRSELNYLGWGARSPLAPWEDSPLSLFYSFGGDFSFPKEFPHPSLGLCCSSHQDILLSLFIHMSVQQLRIDFLTLILCQALF